MTSHRIRRLRRMTSLIEDRTEYVLMSEQHAVLLETMMAAESPEYMAGFLAFRESGELIRQSKAAVKDRFISIRINQDMAGFYCLRGMDAGYARPAFGVYICSRLNSRGLARKALDHAIRWSRDAGYQTLMLKVDPLNHRAMSIYEGAGFKSRDRCMNTGHVIMELEVTK